MIVCKFGGTSVGSPEAMQNVYRIVSGQKSRCPVVVVSAFSQVTDMLIEAGNAALKKEIRFDRIRERHLELMKKLDIPESIIEDELEKIKSLLVGIAIVNELNSKIMDHLVSFGEIISSKIVAHYFSMRGLPAVPLNAGSIGMRTDRNFGSAEVGQEAYDLIKKNLMQIKGIPVVTGFIGLTEKNEVTTLGRGGSDYTAAIIGAAVSAEEIQIWTDVNGIMTADPKIVPNARTIETISFDEAAELAFLGAKVLHPKTIKPALKLGIPVKVLNTFEPDNPGTTIVSQIHSPSVFTGLAVKKGIMLINITATRMLNAPGFLSEVFNMFAKRGISVDFIATSEVSVSMTINSKDYNQDIIDEISEFSAVDVRRDKAQISIVGNGMKNVPGMAGKVFGAIGQAGINIEAISLAARKINISFVVDGKDAERAVQVLHKQYFE